MELTIEQILQQGITAHKEGKIQDAERLYRAILQSHPTHPDANHNLGVLAVSVNKADAALPLFKTALEANPKIEQFWLSYIDTLIKGKQFENAKLVIEQAKTQGVPEEKLNALEAQLSPKTQNPNDAKESPSQELLNSLLGHYQNGRYSDTEKLSIEITQDFPKHQLAWKVLGAVLGATGRKAEAVEANQTVVALSPQDAAAHYNLGNTLQELGRLDEAEASYNQAIALKPDYTEAYYNLGVTLKELGRLDEALASYNQAIALKPEYTEAHTNLGNTLKELGRLDEALASFNQAIALKPDYAKAHTNLGFTFKELGRLDEAEASFTQSIALKLDYALAHYGLSQILYSKGNEDLALKSIVKANDIEPQSKEYQLMLRVMEARKSHKGNKAAVGDMRDNFFLKGLTSSRVILNRVVESELIDSLYEMKSIQLDKTKRVGLLASGKTDARYGNGIVSPDFNLFEDASSIIQKVAVDLTKIMMEAVKSDIYIYDSFFNILRAGGGLTPHNHLTTLDRNFALDLSKQKYSLVYYLSVGDQNCKEPGILKLYEPDEDILPCEGMITIFSSSRMHSAVYGGKTDRVMIGVNFYSL
ncbi:tetratricopeptide repeat protein [Paracoccaceae bacterium]|nr:tetratricopeptide repeat protein [Paracoccaceae bacterium]